jgi:uncharacterized protein
MRVPLAFAAAVGGAALGAYRVADRIASRLLVPEPYGLQPEFRVIGYAADAGAGSGHVVLPLPAEARPAQFARAAAEGRYGLLWDDGGSIGHGLLGPCVGRDATSVTRPLRVVRGAAPRAGTPARLDATVFRRDPQRDHGLPFEELTIDGPTGRLVAWWIERPSDGAVVMVHGRRRGDRTEALRALPAVAEGGHSVLITSSRNHDFSDPSPDGLYHYGASEADDLLAAMTWLRGRGVERVVLVTYSMGAAVALLARERWSEAAPALLAVSMDAPLLDPNAVVLQGVRRSGWPELAAWPAARLGLSLAARRSGVDFRGLDLLRLAPALNLPVLVHMTAADGTIPVDLVDAFVARAPTRWLEYRRLERGDHVEAWNVDSEGYESALRGFVERAFRR